MANMLRYLALLNAGVWLGAAGFMFIVAYTIFTAPEMNAAMQSRPEKGPVSYPHLTLPTILLV